MWSCEYQQSSDDCSHVPVTDRLTLRWTNDCRVCGTKLWLIDILIYEQDVIFKTTNVRSLGAWPACSLGTKAEKDATRRQRWPLTDEFTLLLEWPLCKMLETTGCDVQKRRQVTHGTLRIPLPHPPPSSSYHYCHLCRHRHHPYHHHRAT